MDLVADGAIAAGKPVIITSGGKAAQVAVANVAYGPSNGSSWEASSTYYESHHIAQDGTNTGWIVAAYGDDTSGSNRVRLRAHNFSTGSSGSEVHLTSTNGFSSVGRLSGIFYCTTRQMFVFSWVSQYNSSSSTTQFGTFTLSNSGVITFQARTTDSGKRTHDIEYAGNGKFFSVYRLMSNDAARIAGPHTINSNGTITLNSSELDFITWNNSPATHIGRLRFNSDYSKFVIGYTRTSNYNAYARVGSWNGSGGAGSGAMSLGSELNLSGSGISGYDWQSGFDLCCDKTSGKWVASYGFSSGSKAKCITNSSGTNIAAGSQLSIDSENADGRFRVHDNPTVNNVVTWAGRYTSGFGAINLTISGTNTLSKGTMYQMVGNSPSEHGVGITGLDKIYVINRNDGSNDTKIYRVTVAAAGSNFSSDQRNFLGFAEDAISDGNTGTITLAGNIVGNQSGLTPGLLYKTNNDGTLTQSWGNGEVGLLAIASDKGQVVRSLQ